MNFAQVIELMNSIGQRAWEWYVSVSRPILDAINIIFDKAFYAILFIAIIISLLYLVALFFSSLPRRDKRWVFDESKAPLVTVQIPTYNELVALQCASRCLEFDYPRDKFEIIIGDDSNSREVSQKIDAFALQHSQVKVTRRGSNHGYKAGNLNHMLSHSKGEILVLFDSDFLPEKGFLKEIVAPFQHDPGIAAVQARWKFLNAGQNFVSILGASVVAVFHHITLPFIGRSKISFLCGSAEAVRKGMLVELGGWQHGSLTEDIEYSLRLLKSGKRIVYLDYLACDGEVPHKSRDLYRQQMRWAYGVISAFRQHGKEIITNGRLSLKDKFFITFMCTGYLLSVILIGLFITGMLSFVTHPPGPIDFGKFLFETGRNILLTSGLLLVTAIALKRSNNAKSIGRMLASSFSYGLMMTLYVNIGIFKVIAGQPMKWYMLTKKGNTDSV
ncbi:glycosyltransferase [Candidatus Woesearchaeota archaeon]|nr:glycosyltransferase [Candidatus Woesearchaeota archaeon]